MEFHNEAARAFGLLASRYSLSCQYFMFTDKREYLVGIVH
jgi:hypothetical protein